MLLSIMITFVFVRKNFVAKIVKVFLSFFVLLFLPNNQGSRYRGVFMCVYTRYPSMWRFVLPEIGVAYSKNEKYCSRGQY